MASLNPPLLAAAPGLAGGALGGAIAGGGAALFLLLIVGLLKLMTGGRAETRVGQLVLQHNLFFRCFSLAILLIGVSAMVLFAVRQVAGWATPDEKWAVWCFLGFMVLPGFFSPSKRSFAAWC